MKIDKYFHLYSRKNDVVFEEIPKPERKKGKWIHEYLASTAGGSYPVIRCSECQGALPFTFEYAHCPICGAEMRGEE